MLPEPPRGAVILFDRGVVDNVAYCTEAANGSNAKTSRNVMQYPALGSLMATKSHRIFDVKVSMSKSGL